MKWTRRDTIVSTQKAPLGFLIIAEAGSLERKTSMLVESIRIFGGPLKDAPIWVVQPRKGEPLQPKTLAFFDSRQVHFHYQDLNNGNLSRCGYANKAFAAA